MKQEIAKEGILPFSRFFARNTTTLVARLGAKSQSRKAAAQRGEELEQSPAAALLLHWIFSVLLIAFTSGQGPSEAYTILVSLYTYVISLLVAFFVASGLLYLRWRNRKAWKEISVNFRPWGGPTAAILLRYVVGKPIQYQK